MPKRQTFDVESSDDEDSDSKLGRPSLPAGVLRKKGAIWEGEQMELEHYREDRLAGDNRKRQGTATAVDLTQFQNIAVGHGYQAKHVIRQRTVEEEPNLKINKYESLTPKKEVADRNTMNYNKNDIKVSTTAAPDLLRQKQLLLQSKAMRDFRRELENMK
jgi:hypothetical protein